MTRLLLTLLLLFGAHTVAVAGDFEDGRTAYDRKDYATAFAKFKKAAEAGNAIAQYAFGQMYAYGKGVAQDDGQAVRWYTKAAEAGYADAQLRLASMYDRGEGVPQDDVQAAHWYTKVAEAGNAGAQVILGDMYVNGKGVAQDYQQAVRWFTKAAEAGHAFGQYLLGKMYENGQGVPQDLMQAVRWFTKAAEAGNASGKNSLERMYLLGPDGPQDSVQAVRWYTKAAEEGNLIAQYKLGVMYANGQGVAQDYGQAVRWFTKAAQAGYADAQFILGTMYADGLGVAQDYLQAARWLTKAAEAGVAGAQINLGVMYDHGAGVTQDFVQAYKWFNLAAATQTDKENRERAVSGRNRVAEKMTAQQLAEAQRLAREWKPMTGTDSDRRQDTGGREPAASGTGFVISRQGHVLTNNHVVEGCMTIRTTSEGGKKQLTVVGTDPGNDLALLKLPSPSPNIARFREGRNVRAGDGVVVVGFPLHGLLASEANVTTGTVSALAGIGNDTRFLQITAPIQPGNSGGPLLDQGGNIVGIVVSKLNAMKIAKVTGDIPQNINFAINGAVAKSFLDANSVEYEMASSGKRLESSDVGGQAKKFTLLLECFK